jgi:uncharacterized Zn finger protein (UPF0148 family)
METYTIDCPLCEQSVSTEAEDYEVIYFVEAYESNPRRFVSWMSPDADQKIGRDLVIDQDWIRTIKLQCDEQHYIFLRVTHYENVDEEDDRLYGPAEEPDVFCPSCSARFANHSEYILRFDKSLKMQYILRTVSSSPNDKYTYAESITSGIAGQYSQLCEVHECRHCGLGVHFNYSNKQVNQDEKYQGIQ